MREESPWGPGEANQPSRLDELLTRAVSDTGAHVCAVYLLDDEHTVLTMHTQFGLPTRIARAWARIRLNDPVPIAAAVREGRLIWLGDRERLARDYPGAALGLPYRFGVLAAPVRTDDRVWGGLLMLCPAGHASGISTGELRVIDDVRARVGEVLRQAAERGSPLTPPSRPRSVDPKREAREDPEAGLKALLCLNLLPEGYCSLDVEGRVTLLSAQAAEMLGASPADLLGRRPWEALPWLDDALCEDRYRAAVIALEATHFTTRGPGGRTLWFWLYPGPAGITVRITLSMELRRPGYLGPGARDDRPARAAAPHEMLRLSTTLAGAVTAQEVIDLVADHVMPVYDVHALAILTTVAGRLRVAASRGYSRRAVHELEGRPASPPRPAFDPSKPAFFENWDELRGTYPEAVRSDDMSAWAFLPLITSGGHLGTAILAYDRPHTFSTSERATLAALAGVIAQAFERARLYDVKQQLASCLQESLLPRTLPELPGLELAARYEPATPGMSIGGDFYDVIRLSDTVAAAVIGDVQGHDVTAAALMGQVRTAIRAHATAGASPGEVLTHTNRLLVELAPDRFSSCLYVSIDVGRHLACLAGAGHLPPLLGLPDGPAQVIGTAPGLLLGIDPEAEYDTLELELTPGSVLTLYTDGLVERPGLDLGDAIAGLAARFTPSPERPLTEVAESLINEVPMDRRTDDIALLLLRMLP